MISVLITAFKEPNTVGKAIVSFLPQISKKDEILVACPDRETKQVVGKYAKKYKQVKYVKDLGKGKPAALNILFKKAKGDILILSDGDVFVEKNAVNEILKPFSNPKTGAVSGRPISLNSRNEMLGYWSHLLTDTAHKIRLGRSEKSELIVCSGYLYAIREGIIKKCPENALSEDAVISHLIWAKGYKTAYAPLAKVYVKYPTTFSDWLKQKKRSAGGYVQIKDYVKNTPIMRSFGKESLGVFDVLGYPKRFKERMWTVLLIKARLWLWWLIFLDLKIKKKPFKDTWLRIESTK